MTIIRSHWRTLYACDFFALETVSMFGTVRFMVSFVIELRTRAVHIAGCGSTKMVLRDADCVEGHAPSRWQ